MLIERVKKYTTQKSEKIVKKKQNLLVFGHWVGEKFGKVYFWPFGGLHSLAATSNVKRQNRHSQAVLQPAGQIVG